jgi:L-alanine-DL-glutamate epimerase-like enolase superfamily enzyme
MLGLARRGAPTSYTISLDDPDAMARAAVTAAARFQRLKLKLGGRDGLDLERVRAVRSVTPVALQVDVNEGWDLSEALAALPALERLGVESVEQPLPAGHDGAPELRSSSPIPIYLDEECAGVLDIDACADRGHGINIKLSKVGGIRAALRTIEAARDRGLGVMVGCMIESTLGIAAACQIASLCDHADLDTNLLLARDRWSGVELAEGVQIPADAPGLGVERRRWPAWR